MAEPVFVAIYSDNLWLEVCVWCYNRRAQQNTDVYGSGRLGVKRVKEKPKGRTSKEAKGQKA